MDEPMDGQDSKTEYINRLQSLINGYLVHIAVIQEKITALQNEIRMLETSSLSFKFG